MCKKAQESNDVAFLFGVKVLELVVMRPHNSYRYSNWITAVKCLNVRA